MALIVENFNDKSVCVMGLGYVGLPLAVLLANVGFKVLGVEIQEKFLAELKKGKPHFFEPGLKEQLGKAIKGKNISFKKNIPVGYNVKVYIITVGTPLSKDGKVRLDMIESVAEEISKHLKDGDLVILRSTVKIGTTRKIIMPILAKSGIKFDLAFCPERILEGRALEDLRQLPQIVSGITPSSTIRAAQFFQFLTSTVVKVNSVETAELIKLIDNTSRDASFAFSNEVARICDAVGVSAIEVIQAGKLGYPRTNLPLPGPVGGPCLSKDSYILSESLEGLGLSPEIILVSRKVNEKQPEEIAAFLSKTTKNLKNFSSKPIISLMGITFKGKPAVDDLRGTMAEPIFKSLKKYFPKAIFRGYDPVISKEKIRNFGLIPFSTIEGAMKDSSLILILNNHPIFNKMDIENLACLLAKPGLIYDFWNNFTDRALHLPKDIQYLALGSHCKLNLLNKDK